MYQSNIVAATMLAVGIAGGAAVSAQTQPGAQARPAPRPLAPGLSEKPYAGIFDKQQLFDVEKRLSETAAALPLRMRPNSARRFICGIGVVPAGSDGGPAVREGPG